MKATKTKNNNKKKTRYKAKTYFGKKVLFDMGEKVGFTSCVFEKLCFAENTLFIVFSEKHSSSETKYVCWTKQKIYEKYWVVFELVFFVFFEVLMLLWCLFGVSGIVPKVLKNACFFPSFGGFCGVGYFCLFGFRRFRCFGVLVFVFLFLCWFCFCFVCFVFV